MRVGIDLDGPVYDFVDGLKRSMPHEYRALPANEYAFHKKWGLTTPEFLTYCCQGVRNGILFWTGSPEAHAKETFKELRAGGHEIVILTHRGIFGEGEALAKNATEFWLETNQLEYDELILIEDKTSIHTDAMIEDKVENFLALAEHGNDAYLIDKPWNREIETANRVFSLQEFKERILAK